MSNSNRQKLEQAKVYVKELNKYVVPFDVAISILELEEDEDFTRHLDTLKEQVDEIGKLFDDLNEGLV